VTSGKYYPILQPRATFRKLRFKTLDLASKPLYTISRSHPKALAKLLPRGGFSHAALQRLLGAGANSKNALAPTCANTARVFTPRKPVLDLTAMKFQAVKGTYDILPSKLAKDVYEDQNLWHYVYEVVNRVLSRAGVKELTTPVLEQAEVFTKSVGESSDIVVQKEMYTLEDAGGRFLALRPEFTGGVMRAFIEHGMHVQPLPVKLWNRGPIFRAEVQPQRGRFRQFHQVNCEIIGLENPATDAEAITLLYTVLSELGLKNMVVKLGSVGDPQDRVVYNQYLRETLENANLSETSRERLRLNPMRVLDSKDKGDQDIVKGLKKPLEFINTQARAHFDFVQKYLSDWKIPFEIDDSIVRGLDYYRRTAFEVHHKSIGAQSALCGGGRYDGLIESLGGTKTPGVGWAFGVERVLDAMQQDGVTVAEASKPVLYFVPLDDEAISELMQASFALRNDYHVEHGYAPRKPGKGLQEADRAGATYAALRGKFERENKSYQVKNLKSGEQVEVKETELKHFLEKGTSG
jgi:histidyl-tRNA synthetase